MAGAQEQHHHREEASTASSLGTVSFPISCSGKNQVDFDGIALLQSFSHKNASLKFQQISQRDPSCAMAYWGDAISLHRQLWDRPKAEELAQGAKLVREAKA